MKYKGIDRRTCERFEIPDATLSYRLKKIFFSEKKHSEKYCPIIEISFGGVRFLCQKFHKPTNTIYLKLTTSNEKSSLPLKGKIVWTSLYAASGYKYQIGVQFDPFGTKKGQNDPEIMNKLSSLQKELQNTNNSQARNRQPI